MSNSKECIICFENLTDYSVAILSCGHKFHLHCIQGWKNTQGRKSNYTRLCSICRDTNVEITNIIDGTKQDPQPIKRRLSTESTESHLYQRRRVSIPSLDFVQPRNINTNEDLWCCCNIL